MPGSRFKTGQYLGDGAISRPITGIGFRVDYVKIWLHTAGGFIVQSHFEKTRTMNDTTRCWETTVAGQSQASSDLIISCDNDGFTIGDGGIDQAPNKAGDTYDYIVMGSAP